MRNIFKNKNILVTGGVGSIGSELVNQLIKFKPSVIRVFDNNEHRLFELNSLIKTSKNLRPLLGDVRDPIRLRKAMIGVDIVFHAAALKHVEISEYNPFEAVSTNIIGTQNVIETSLLENVDKVVVISTDKAVNPVNTMGATKLVAEKLTVAAYYHKGKKRTKFAVVRFGNVLDSNGSVVPTWVNQIKKGEKITITDREMTRFMMSLKHAVSLVFDAAVKMKGGEIFIFKMPALRIVDLADVLIQQMASKYNYSPKAGKYKEIGIRPGEKLHEVLVTREEMSHLYETKKMYIVLPKREIVNLIMKKVVIPFKKTKLSDKNAYSSEFQKLLSKSKIGYLLKSAKIIS